MQKFDDFKVDLKSHLNRKLSFKNAGLEIFKDNLESLKSIS